MKSVQYPYSKANSLFYTIFLFAFIIVSIPYLIKAIVTHDSVIWLLITLDIFFLLVLIYMIIKQLIPSFRNTIALEINSTGIISYVKNVTLEWNYIDEIKLKTGKSHSSLYITFKWATDHGNDIHIPLQFVKGNDEKICDTALEYLKKSK